MHPSRHTVEMANKGVGFVSFRWYKHLVHLRVTHPPFGKTEGHNWWFPPKKDLGEDAPIRQSQAEPKHNVWKSRNWVYATTKIMSPPTAAKSKERKKTFIAAQTTVSESR
jgi:hypothetical protein